MQTYVWSLKADYVSLCTTILNEIYTDKSQLSASHLILVSEPCTKCIRGFTSVKLTNSGYAE